jgi:hypothetical protein
MTEQPGVEAEVIAWELGELDIIMSYGHGWLGYCVGSKNEA